MPQFSFAAPGSLASQRISRLEKENRELKNEVESLRKRAELAEAMYAGKALEEDVPPPPPPGLPFHGHKCQKNVKHPKVQLAHLKCGFPGCGNLGHTEHNCQLRLRYDLRMIAENCQEGWHKPYLHDSMYMWRCQWCKLHLHEDYVQVAYPTEFAKERSKVAAFHRKSTAKYTSRISL